MPVKPPMTWSPLIFIPKPCDLDVRVIIRGPSKLLLILKTLKRLLQSNTLPMVMLKNPVPHHGPGPVNTEPMNVLETCGKHVDKFTLLIWMLTNMPSVLKKELLLIPIPAGNLLLQDVPLLWDLISPKLNHASQLKKESMLNTQLLKPLLALAQLTHGYHGLLETVMDHLKLRIQSKTTLLLGSVLTIKVQLKLMLVQVLN